MSINFESPQWRGLKLNDRQRRQVAYAIDEDNIGEDEAPAAVRQWLDAGLGDHLWMIVRREGGIEETRRWVAAGMVAGADGLPDERLSEYFNFMPETTDADGLAVFREYFDLEFDFADADAWYEAGFDALGDAKLANAYIEAGIDDPDEAAEWRAHFGADVERVASFLELEFDAETAGEWVAAGVPTVDEFGEWESWGFDDPETVSEWIKAGFRSTESETELAYRYSELVSAESAGQYARAGVTPELLAQLGIDNNTDNSEPPVVLQAIQLPLTEEAIQALNDAGLLEDSILRDEPYDLDADLPARLAPLQEAANEAAREPADESKTSVATEPPTANGEISLFDL